MNEELTRRMPFSLEAEQSVLGAILINPECFNDLAGLLTVEDFQLEEHRDIYNVMQSMYLKSREIDVVTLIDELVKNGTYDEAGGKEYIRLIAELVPSSANVKDYANIVREKALLRSLITTCGEITEDAFSEQDDADRQLELAEAKIFAIAEKRENKGFTHIKDALVGVYQHLQDVKNDPIGSMGVPTGFSGLDRVLVGLGKSDLVLVGARPGMGKTSFALNIATNVARSTKKTVCIFSLEMSTEQLITRMLASEALVDSYKLRSGDLPDEDWTKLAHAASSLSGTDILIDDTSGITVSGMKSKLRRVKNLEYVRLLQTKKRAQKNQRDTTKSFL